MLILDPYPVVSSVYIKEAERTWRKDSFERVVNCLRKCTGLKVLDPGCENGCFNHEMATKASIHINDYFPCKIQSKTSR